MTPTELPKGRSFRAWVSADYDLSYNIGSKKSTHAGVSLRRRTRPTRRPGLSHKELSIFANCAFAASIIGAAALVLGHSRGASWTSPMKKAPGARGPFREGKGRLALLLLGRRRRHLGAIALWSARWVIIVRLSIRVRYPGSALRRATCASSTFFACSKPSRVRASFCLLRVSSSIVSSETSFAYRSPPSPSHCRSAP